MKDIDVLDADLITSSGRQDKCAIWIAAAVSFFAVLCPIDSLAEGYILEKGKKYSLCREYLQNLQNFAVPQVGPVSFEWPIDPKLRNFSKPNWRPIDPKSWLDIVEKIYLGRVMRTPTYREMSDELKAQVWPKAKASVLEEIGRGLIRMETAPVDFNNDGKFEQAFRYGRKIHAVKETLTSQSQPLVGWWYWFESDVAGVSSCSSPMWGLLAMGSTICSYTKGVFIFLVIHRICSISERSLTMCSLSHRLFER